MNQTQIFGRWLEFKGSLMETVGKWFDNSKLQSDGQAQRVRGRIQAAANSNENLATKRKEVGVKPTLN